MRLFPAVLAILCVVGVAIANKQPKIIRRIFSTKSIINEQRETEEYLVMAFRYLLNIDDYLNRAVGGNKCAPLAEILYSAMLPIVSNYIDRDFQEVFFQAEFIVALGFASAIPDDNMPFVLPGRYLYGYHATKSIRNLLIRDIRILEFVFGDNIRRLLEIFDQTAIKVVNPGCVGFTSGFVRGAVDAFNPPQKSIK